MNSTTTDLIHQLPPPTTWQEAINRQGSIILAGQGPWDAWTATDRARTLRAIDGHLEPFRDHVREGTTPSDTSLEIAYVFVGGLAHHFSELDMQATERFVTKKQIDYGTGNVLAFGHVGLIVRQSDKIARLKNLIAKDSNGTVEPMADAWLDLVGYSLVGLMLLNDTFELPLRGVA